MRILLVEDESITRTSFASGLRARGHHVDEAKDGGQALAFLDGQAHDIFIIDIVTPRMSGLEFLFEAHKKGLKPKVLIVTAYSPNFCSGIEGIDRIVTKPIDSEFLVEQVEQLGVHHGKGG